MNFLQETCMEKIIVKISKSILKRLVKESLESDDYVEEIKLSFDPMTINDLILGAKSANIPLNIPVKFLSGGHHISVKSLSYVEPESGNPYFLLDL